MKRRYDVIIVGGGAAGLACAVFLGRKGCDVQRYKGLGEMNAEQLWNTTMNPEFRTLVQATMDDAFEADEIFTVLMGEMPEMRRQFIEENARFVKNLDI